MFYIPRKPKCFIRLYNWDCSTEKRRLILKAKTTIRNASLNLKKRYTHARLQDKILCIWALRSPYLGCVPIFWTFEIFFRSVLYVVRAVYLVSQKPIAPPKCTSNFNTRYAYKILHKRKKWRSSVTVKLSVFTLMLCRANVHATCNECTITLADCCTAFEEFFLFIFDKISIYSTLYVYALHMRNRSWW